LLQEAVLRALTGTRPWPPAVPLLAFLAGVMRSLCDEQWRRHRRQEHLPILHGGGADDPERACAAAEALAARHEPHRAGQSLQPIGFGRQIGRDNTNDHRPFVVLKRRVAASGGREE
jgi:RNA polymerase sigma-70 factor (ECF subfamily)